MKGVRAELLGLVPELVEDAASVNTLASRAELAHHIVRQHLAALVREGSVESTVGPDEITGAVPRYFRTTQEGRGDQAPLADRILGLRLGDAGMTILEIAAELQVRPAAVSVTLLGMIELEQVVRTGKGKRGDPFRHTWPADTAPADALPTVPEAIAMLQEGQAGAWEAAHGDSEADTSPVAPDVEPAGTEVPAETEALPAGYTDVPEVLAAKMAAEPADEPGDTVGGTVRVFYEPEPTTDEELRRAMDREADMQRYIDDPLGERDRAAADSGPTLSDDGEDAGTAKTAMPPRSLGHCYAAVIADVETRAGWEDDDAAVLRAAATLLGRILDGEADR